MVQVSERTLTQEIKDFTLGAGADIVGVVSVDHLEQVIPSDWKPRRWFKEGQSVISFGIGALHGALACPDDNLKNYSNQKVLEALDHTSYRLAKHLERLGYHAIIIPAGPPTDLNPPGRGMWGWLSQRHVAVEAGLGEIGLNTSAMVPEFGPRVYFGSVITSATLEPDPKREDKLCLGERCSLCIKACPTGALSLAEGSGGVVGVIDKKKCQPNAQSWGLAMALRHIRDMIREPEEAEKLNLLFGEKTWFIWQSLLTHVGIDGMCGVCLDICPVGKHRKPHSLKEKALAVLRDKEAFKEYYKR
jgi:epoxyqueuosine reductase QueG